MRAETPSLADKTFQLHALLTLELWHRTFLDRTWSFDARPAVPAAL